MKNHKSWYNGRTHIFFDTITHSKRFIDKNGEHPKINDTIDGINIVLNKEELNKNNWMLLVNNEEERKQAKMQIEELVRRDDWIPILKEG